MYGQSDVYGPEPGYYEQQYESEVTSEIETDTSDVGSAAVEDMRDITNGMYGSMTSESVGTSNGFDISREIAAIYGPKPSTADDIAMVVTDATLAALVGITGVALYKTDKHSDKKKGNKNKNDKKEN